jgi:hypothetical protein
VRVVRSTKKTAASLGRGGGGQVGRPALMRGTTNLRTSGTPEGDRLMTRGQRTKPPSLAAQGMRLTFDNLDHSTTE